MRRIVYDMAHIRPLECVPTAEGTSDLRAIRARAGGR